VQLIARFPEKNLRIAALCEIKGPSNIALVRSLSLLGLDRAPDLPSTLSDNLIT
jgi:hypothetical protein